jgi:hypothetical protein
MTESAACFSRPGLAGVQMMKLAESRRFAVDESTGNKLMEAFEGTLRTLEAHWDALQRLRDAPALGRTATARWVSVQMVGTAVDERGLLSQLETAREEFPLYVAAIKLAIQNYSESGARS